jgi:Domain of unknown function (DUF6431)
VRATGLPIDHLGNRVQHELPLPRPGELRQPGGHDPEGCAGVLLYLDPEQTDADLGVRRLRCPSCPDGRLAPWAHARPRVVSLLDGRRERLTPRRARCTDCRRTHVLLPSWCVPRRGHGVEVIATALADQLRGGGYHGIAGRLGVPAGTVRGWLRRVGRGAEGLRAAATGHLYGLDPAAPPLEPTGSHLGDALAALAAAVHAAQHRLGHARPGQRWALLGQLGLTQILASARAG